MRHATRLPSPHAPATAQHARRLVHHFAREAKTLQDLARAQFGRGQIAVGQLLVHVLQAHDFSFTRTVGFCLRFDCILLFRQLLKDGVALQHLCQHAFLTLWNLGVSVGTSGHFLLDIHHADVGGEAVHLTTGNVTLSQFRIVDLPKQGRFTNSVTTDQTVLVTVYQLQTRANNQLLSRNADSNVIHGNVHGLALGFHVHRKFRCFCFVHLFSWCACLKLKQKKKKDHLATFRTAFHTFFSSLQHLHVLFLVNVVVCVDKQLG